MSPRRGILKILTPSSQLDLRRRRILGPAQEPEDEDSIQEAMIETLPARVDVTRTSATEPPGTIQAFVLPHNLIGQAIVDPEENPKRWDRAELDLAISPQLTLI